MQVELTDTEAKVVQAALARCMADDVLRPTLGNRLMALFDSDTVGTNSGARPEA